MARLEGVNERNNDTRTRVSDGMTKSNSSTNSANYIKTNDSKRANGSYPLTLIFAGSMLQTFSAMRTTTEKASLNSNSDMSLVVRLAFSNAFGRATVGASGKSIGSTPASAHAVNVSVVNS